MTQAVGSELAVSGSALAPEQQQFQKLLIKIDKMRANLDGTKRVLDEFRDGVSARVHPLEREIDQAKLTLGQVLDERLSRPGLTPKIREDITGILIFVVHQLIDGELALPAIEILERHLKLRQGGDQPAVDATQPSPDDSLFSQDPELDPDDRDAVQASFEELMRSLEAEALERENEAAARGVSRKLTKKQLAAQEDERDAVAAMRDLYRKLVSSLHPDREPDAERRASKTIMLGKVNAAYAQKDLVTLLHLQGEAFTQDMDLAAVGASVQGKLRHFNRLLQQQLNELTAQHHELQHAAWRYYNIGWGAKLTAQNLERVLRREVEAAARVLRRLTEAIEDAGNDASLKPWAKAEARAMREGF